MCSVTFFDMNLVKLKMSIFNLHPVKNVGLAENQKFTFACLWICVTSLPPNRLETLRLTCQKPMF